MNTAIADLRKNHTKAALDENTIHPDPFQQFHLWLNQALESELPEPNAMTLATTTPDGKPSARMVLLKSLDQKGFVFYTNYTSRKAQQLEANPQAALVFWWAELERQVRIEGIVEKVTPQESDAYFNSRPLGSKLGAWASPQSSIIPSRETLENNLTHYENQYQDQTIPRPPHWGGFRLIPHQIEFWQGRPKRLHDRLVYSLDDQGKWGITRLAP